MNLHLLFLKYSLAVSSLVPIMHVCATDYYQVGMHRFAIREPGDDAAMWPAQKYMPVPETFGEPVFNNHYLVCMILPGSLFFNSVSGFLGLFLFGNWTSCLKRFLIYDFDGLVSRGSGEETKLCLLFMNFTLHITRLCEWLNFTHPLFFSSFFYMV